MAAKKMSRAQVAALGGLAIAEKTDMKRLGSRGGQTTLERYGALHMKKLALRKNGYSVALKTEPRTVQPFPVDLPARPSPRDDDELFEDVVRKSAGWSR